MWNNYYNLMPMDNVSGFTLTELEDALYGVQTWLAWRDRIKAMYPNKATVGYIDELFANYN